MPVNLCQFKNNMDIYLCTRHSLSSDVNMCLLRAVEATECVLVIVGNRFPGHDSRDHRVNAFGGVRWRVSVWYINWA